MIKPNYRADIDGLRGIAVLAVISYHAFPNWVAGGFVGVDVFFVISGFLISTIIFQSLEAGSFSYGEFYERRIKRIFPALIVVLLGCAILGRIVLFSDEYKQLGKHTVAGATFISNFVLWSEISYFDNSAETKPLLHLWSLGIEEQFYVLWPLILGLVWKRRISFLTTTALIGITSFAINILTTSSNPAAAFYSPASRFWELMAGGALAYIAYHKRDPVQGGNNWISAGGLLAIAGSVFLLNRTNAFPGWWAVLPVAGTCLVIASPRAWANQTLLGNRLLVGIGLISYPLYLWHWPLLSFAHIWQGSTLLSRTTRIGLLAASFLAAWLTYKFVERPIRIGRVARPVLSLSCVLAAMGIVGAGIVALDGFPDDRQVHWTNLKNWQHFTNETCLKRYPFDRSEMGWWFCVTNRDSPPTLILLGNSYANHLYPGFAGNRRLNHHTILSIGLCDPVKGVLIDETWMRGSNPCFGYRQRDIDEFIDEVIARNPSIRYAVLNSSWPDFDSSGNAVNRDGSLAGHVIPVEKTEGQAISSMDAYINGLEERLGVLETNAIIPILFLPKPETEYDVRECFSRLLKFAKQSCAVSRIENTLAQERFVAAVRQLQTKHPTLVLFDQYGVFCQGDQCAFLRGGRPLLRDKGHLSEYGSELMADHFAKWAEDHLPSLFNAPPVEASR
jgi:peptidoglycan/LPS O-acetylase OafA/YrhL